MTADAYVRVPLRVHEDAPIRLSVAPETPVTYRVGEYVEQRTSSYPDYDGPYGVTPRLSAQTLATADRVLRADMEIGGIPSYRTTNVGGGFTVTIAQD